MSVLVIPEVEVFGGGGFETAACPTRHRARLDGWQQHQLARWPLPVANYVYSAVAYTQLQFLNRTVTDSRAALPNGRPVASDLQPDGNGTYTQWIGVVDMNLEKQF